MDSDGLFLLLVFLLIAILILPGMLVIRLVIKLRILALEMIGNTWAVKHLIKFLEYSKWSKFIYTEGEEQAQAARALGKIGSVQAVEPLIHALRHKYPSVREAAVEALWEIGDIQAIDPLIRAFGDNELDIRAKAMEAVEQIGSPAVEPLIKALGDKKSVIRSGAAAVLGRLGDGRAVEPLIKVLEDRISDVRYNAAEALDNISWKPENMVEKIFYLLARRDWESLVLLGTPAIEPLTEIFEEYTRSMRGDAEIGLQKLYALVETIIFGNIESTIALPNTALLNPDVLTLTLPMSNLKRLEIHTETYNFHQVECFLTYAVNYIGQKHLKENVEVDIYGDPDKLHPNLRNNFEFLCKRVKLIEHC